MFVAGVPLSRDDVLELARLVDPELAEKLHTAVDRETAVLALTVPEREAILWALDDPPDGLTETPRRPARRAYVAEAGRACLGLPRPESPFRRVPADQIDDRGIHA